jgi:IclR family transcriptional regulator, acetate operon repressor
MHSAVRNESAISMLDRSVMLLLAFRSSGGAMTLAQLCQATGIPKATAHRLVGELEKWGLLERSGRRLRLGMRLFELGQLVPTQRDIGEIAAPYLAELFEATRETVHLAVRDGQEVLYVQKLAHRGSPQVGSRVGGRMPMHCTGVGKAMLAFNSTALTDAVIAQGLRRLTPRTIVAPGLLRRDLARTRVRGFAVEREESTTGIVCVAGPIIDVTGNAVAAISMTGRVHQFSAPASTAAVRTAALGLSRALR